MTCCIRAGVLLISHIAMVDGTIWTRLFVAKRHRISKISTRNKTPHLHWTVCLFSLFLCLWWRRTGPSITAAQPVNYTAGIRNYSGSLESFAYSFPLTLNCFIITVPFFCKSREKILAFQYCRSRFFWEQAKLGDACRLHFWQILSKASSSYEYYLAGILSKPLTLWQLCLCSLSSAKKEMEAARTYPCTFSENSQHPPVSKGWAPAALSACFEKSQHCQEQKNSWYCLIHMVYLLDGSSQAHQ